MIEEEKGEDDSGDEMEIEQQAEQEEEEEYEQEEGEEGEEDEQEEQQEEQYEEEQKDENSNSILSDQSYISDQEISTKKKSQRAKELLKHSQEQQIRSLERLAADENALPQSADEFEKLILQNPNSSFLWVQYTAFIYESEGLAQAREILERALRVIAYKKENEKLNLWTAYMNLEFNFGKEKDLVEIFKRAQQQCKPKSVFFTLLDIYRKAGKNELLLELSRTMINKFKRSSKAWLEHIKNVVTLKGVGEEEGKGLLQKALQCLKKKKHIVILTHYGKLMYEVGEQEKGRTTFEAIISNYPKRTDIWNVYLDAEVKYAPVEQIRYSPGRWESPYEPELQLFERCTQLSLKPRKMKFFFKKYYIFEMSRNNTEKAQMVKEKAEQYIQSLEEEGSGEEQEAEEL